MVNAKNFGVNLPSVHYGRAGMNARILNQAMEKRNMAYLGGMGYGFPQGGFNGGYIPIGSPPPWAQFNSFGNSNITINNGMSNSFAAGFALGNIGNWFATHTQTVKNFFNKIFT